MAHISARSPEQITIAARRLPSVGENGVGTPRERWATAATVPLRDARYRYMAHKICARVMPTLMFSHTLCLRHCRRRHAAADVDISLLPCHCLILLMTPYAAAIRLPMLCHTPLRRCHTPLYIIAAIAAITFRLLPVAAVIDAAAMLTCLRHDYI